MLRTAGDSGAVIGVGARQRIAAFPQSRAFGADQLELVLSSTRSVEANWLASPASRSSGSPSQPDLWLVADDVRVLRSWVRLERQARIELCVCPASLIQLCLCDFRAVQIGMVRLAPVTLAPVRMTPVRLAKLRSAPEIHFVAWIASRCRPEVG
jgi:hypothetical protein